MKILRPAFRFALLLVASVLATSAEPVRYESPITDRVETKTDVVYRSLSTADKATNDLHLDVYQPATDTERSRPAILWLHGSGKDRKQGYIVKMATEFAKRGYVSLAIDYREDTGPLRWQFPHGLEDSQAAIAWVRAHAADYGIDPQHIAVGGGSLGGMIGTNLVNAENAAAARARTPGLFAFVDLWGSPFPTMLVAPLDSHFPPTVIVHGTADQNVPFENSEKLAADLKKLDVLVELVPVPGGLHTPINQMDTFVPVVAKFLATTLKK